MVTACGGVVIPATAQQSIPLPCCNHYLRCWCVMLSCCQDGVMVKVRRNLEVRACSAAPQVSDFRNNLFVSAGLPLVSDAVAVGL